MTTERWLAAAALSLACLTGNVKSASASEWVKIRTNVDARSFAGDWLISTDRVTGRNDYYVKYWSGTAYVTDVATGGLGTAYVAGTSITVGPDLIPAMIRADGRVFRRDQVTTTWHPYPQSKCGVSGSFSARRTNGTLRSYLASGFGSATPKLFAVAEGATNSDIYYFSDTGNCWQKTSGAYEQISISATGVIWSVTAAKTLASYDLASDVWTPYVAPYLQPLKIAGGTAFATHTTQQPPVIVWTAFGSSWNQWDDTWAQYTTALPSAVAEFWNKNNPDLEAMLVYSQTERAVRVWTASD